MVEEKESPDEKLEDGWMEEASIHWEDAKQRLTQYLLDKLHSIPIPSGVSGRIEVCGFVFDIGLYLFYLQCIIT